MNEYIDEEQMTPEDEQLMIAERLHVFASRLNQLAKEQIAKRTEIEQRWLEDIRQYHGKYDDRSKVELNRAGGSQVYVNITRNKTNAAEARLQDMLFPTDDRNWAIYPTPVPELDSLAAKAPEQQMMMAQQGMPMQPTPASMAADSIREAEERCEAMQEEIDDQLNESRYQTKARDIIHDACLLGTGVVKGPVVMGRMKKAWSQLPDGTSILQINESLNPTVERVDPWDFFPDMSARTIDEAEYVFQRHLLTKKQLRELSRLPGILIDQLRKVAASEAKSSQLGRDYTSDIRYITGINTVDSDSKYELWEYHGPISKSELIDAIAQADDVYEQEEIDELDDEVDAVVFFSGNSVLKVVINPMDTTERPFSVFNWEKDDSTVFGFGVPYLMRNPQKVINASWRMMMDNAGLSIADQVIINREIVEPADGSWQMTPKKLWFLRDKTRAVNEAMAAFSTPSHQQELANIFSMARQLADEETNLPLIAQGEMAPHVTQTASGMQMLMNSSNIVLRKAIKNWDDDITRPLLTRFYDWNMQYNEKPGIKGDFSVDARGSGALLVKDKQQESLMIYANMSAGNPMLASRRDWAGLDREIAKSLEIPYDNVTLSEEEIMEMQASQQPQEPPPDPMLQFKQIEMQVEQAKVQLRAQEIQQKAELDRYRLDLETQIEQQKLAQERELKMAELAAKANMTREQLQTRMALDMEKNKTMRDAKAAETNVKLTQTQLQAQNLAQGFDTY